MTNRECLLLRGPRVLATDRAIDCGWTEIADGQIAALGGKAPPSRSDITLDLACLTLAPGLVDIHVHGALGCDTMDADPASLHTISGFLARHGVTAFLATTMAAPQTDILAALYAIGTAMEQQERGMAPRGAQLLGAHVEGPWIDRERSGCQDPELVHSATPNEYRAILDTGVVRLITLSPEDDGNMLLAREAISRGIAVAAGHTRASYSHMVQAVEAGVSQVTHLFNAMEPMHHRRPGAVGAALSLEGLRCQLIADNVHVHPAVLRLALRAKGIDGIILVSDAMSGTGMPPGEYALGGLTVLVRNGQARLQDGTLAGSTLTLDRAVANMASAADLDLETALVMASRTPARSLGLATKGAIDRGHDADLVAYDGEMRVRLTVVGGEIVYDDR